MRINMDGGRMLRIDNDEVSNLKQLRVALMGIQQSLRVIQNSSPALLDVATFPYEDGSGHGDIYVALGILEHDLAKVRTIVENHRARYAMRRWVD